MDINAPRTLKVYDGGNRATVECRMLRPGKFTSGVNGITFDITNDHLILARNHYNNKLLEYVKDIFREPLSDYELQHVQMAPVGTEHEIHQDAIKGRIVGKVWIDEDTQKKVNWLWSKLEILGAENVRKIQDGTFKATSINFNIKTGEIMEVSFVFKPAIEDSCVFSAVSPENAGLSHPESEKVKLNLLVTKVNQTIDLIDKTDTDIAKLSKKVEQKRYRAEFADRLQGMVKSGKITRAEMKYTLAAVPEGISPDALQGIAAAFSGLSCRATRGRLYSVSDEFFKELIMDGDSKISTKAVQQVAARIQAKFNATGKFTPPADNAAFAAKPDVEKKSQTETDHTQSDKHKIELKGSESYKEMKTHLKAKGDKDGLKKLCRMAGEEYEDDDDKPELSKEGKFSAAQIEELQAQLSALQSDKEKLKGELANLQVDLKVQTGIVDTFKSIAQANTNSNGGTKNE